MRKPVVQKQCMLNNGTLNLFESLRFDHPEPEQWKIAYISLTNKQRNTQSQIDGFGITPNQISSYPSRSAELFQLH